MYNIDIIRIASTSTLDLATLNYKLQPYVKIAQAITVNARYAFQSCLQGRFIESSPFPVIVSGPSLKRRLCISFAPNLSQHLFLTFILMFLLYRDDFNLLASRQKVQSGVIMSYIYCHISRVQ